MKNRVLSFFLISLVLFADVRGLFQYFALENEVLKRSKASLKYRTIIWLWVKTMPDLFDEYQKKQMSLKRLKDEKFTTIVVLKKKRFTLKPRVKLLCRFDGRLKSIFKVNGKIYFLTEKLEGMSLVRTIYNAKTCKRFKKTRFSYLTTSPSGQLVGLKRINLFRFLDYSLRIIRTVNLKDVLVQNAMGFHGKFLVQRRRLIPRIPAVQIRDGKKINEIFVKSRKAKGSEANLLLQDTALALGEDAIYITFVYPLRGTIEIYEYTLEGEPRRKFILTFDRKYAFLAVWLNYDEIQKKGLKSIYAVSGLFTKGHVLYVVLEKNRIEPSGEHLFHFLLRIDTKTRNFFIISVSSGLPVFYDGKNFYSVSVMKKEIYKLTILEEISR